MKVCLAVDDSEISQNAVDCEHFSIWHVVSTHLDYHRVLHRDNNELIICHVAATCHDDQDSNLTEPHFFSRALEIQLTAVRDLEEKYKRLLSRYPNLVRTDWFVLIVSFQQSVVQCQNSRKVKPYRRLNCLPGPSRRLWTYYNWQSTIGRWRSGFSVRLCRSPLLDSRACLSRLSCRVKQVDLAYSV